MTKGPNGYRYKTPSAVCVATFNLAQYMLVFGKTGATNEPFFPMSFMFFPLSF